MYKIIVLLVAVHYTAAEFDCPTFGVVRDSRCPELQNDENGQKVCFEMITAPYGSAYTMGSGDEECKKRHGADAHLANIYGRKSFEDLRCYMISETDVSRSRDRKVLLGMSYDPDSKKTYLYNGEQYNTYWGQYGYPLSYGTEMIFRAHETLRRSRLLNFGGGQTRFERILCEYALTK